MSSSTFNLESFLSSVDVDGPTEDTLIEGNSTAYTPLFEAGYEGKIDYRIRQLSHSARELFSSCPRKYQLNRLRSTHRTAESIETSITFAFGTVVGEGIQLALQGLPIEDIYWKMFILWKPDLLAEDPKRNKNFFLACFAIQKFKALQAQGFLDEYELVYYQGKPACELDFAISFPDGFRYRGSIDSVFRHVVSGRILVLELKTTGFLSVNPATYKNSGQALGYSIILDRIFPDISSYEVLYLVYKTKSYEFESIPFIKSYTQRAFWIRELLLDIETIKMYEDADVYPMRGNACISYGKDCEYIQSCTMSTAALASNGSEKDFDVREYQITLSLTDLLEAQFAKTSTP